MPRKKTDTAAKCAALALAAALALTGCAGGADNSGADASAAAESTGLQVSDIAGMDELASQLDTETCDRILEKLTASCGEDADVELVETDLSDSPQLGDSKAYFCSGDTYWTATWNSAAQRVTLEVLTEEVEGVNSDPNIEHAKKVRENARKNAEAVAREQAADEKKTQEAKAASTAILLSDAEALEGAGVPAGSAATLAEDYRAWCAKKKLTASTVIHAGDVTASGGSAAVMLIAERTFSGGSEDVRVRAVCDGKSNTFKLA